MDLLALADFTLVARHGGFGKASRAARRPKATLSRRVAELEASLNLRLFERGRRDLKLTEEGRALFERAGALLVELEETAAAISSRSEHVRGALRISAPLLFSQVAMGRIAAEFVRLYPDVRLEITTDDRSVDMIEEGYDLAIRVNPAPDDVLVGRAFLHDRLVIVSAPEHPWSPDRPVSAVVRGQESARNWMVATAAGSETIAIDPLLRMSSMIMIRDAVRAGAGAAHLPLSLVSGDISSGRLVHRGDVGGSEITLWALYPSRRLLNARVGAFLEHLRQCFPKGVPEELAAYM